MSEVGMLRIVFIRSQDTIAMLTRMLTKMGRNWKADRHLDGVLNSRDFQWTEGHDFARIYGADKGAEYRTRVQADFNDKNKRRLRLLMVSIQSGSAGMNLIGANRVVIFDVDWNPANDRQALHHWWLAEQWKKPSIYKVQFNKDMNNESFNTDLDIKKQYTVEEASGFYSLSAEPYSKQNPPVLEYGKDDSALQSIIKKHPELFVKITEPSLMLKLQEDDFYLSPEEMANGHRRLEQEKEFLNLGPSNIAVVEEEIQQIGKGFSDFDFINMMRTKVGNVRKNSFSDAYYGELVGIVKPMYKAASVYMLYRDLDRLYREMTPEQVKHYFNFTPKKIIELACKDLAANKKGDRAITNIRKLLQEIYRDLKDDRKLKHALDIIAKSYHGVA
ncbi:unnamed protein product [Bursaphelenchus okinawaensis]|uniref:Helicase C-terminal domain-containing protein n=1 Tax=Bursaphelenchus okinawaensis TaxID=465554 RepID=A0A811JSS0_9BILA|nr:unnamed protein product [Bursaphelenchus okinawaensis]CAG9081286.1 unnamed protein product [Bursaphelenchus okinawaensis]